MHDLRRRILRSALALALLAWAALGWAQGTTPAAKPAKAPREDLTIDPRTIMEPWSGDLDAMVERRIVRVLVVPSKTFYFNDKGRQRGATYDTFQLVEKELENQLKREKKATRKHLKVQFFFIPVGRDEIFSALVAGKGDIAAANLSITPRRQELVDFSTPHTTNVSELVLTGPASPAVSTLDDLAGKEVFVRKSSSYYESLVALNQRFAAENKPPVRLKEAPDELEDEDLIEMLNAGLVPMLVVDKHIADFWKKVFPKIKVHDAIAVNTEGDIGWAIRKDSPQLKAFLDRTVAALTTGHLADERQQILTRYFQRLGHVKNAASDAERKKFLALVDLFRKYGDRYDVDWLLMAAQGYQESRLNQEARSPVGAIGVMQVMPATGQDMNVGDITQAEANIHAGVKYMRFMIDRFYGNEPMTRLDKALFAFAAYNCGPGRVAQLRKEAAKRGLDPNVWFHNVEYIAEEKIGHETVTYVANIYKYYVAYELIEDSLQERQEAIKSLKSGSNQK
ncbi:MAG TPA: transporter substrate-binding domain-containing protein [Burkholderiaceae bacterium]|nr:transporter substrate-binding domain-containing protein [Burkholderiaceae bacterium]